MTAHNDKINELLAKLENLQARQNYFSGEINQLRLEINRLKYAQAKEQTQENKDTETTVIISETQPEKVASVYQKHKEEKPEVKPSPSPAEINLPPQIKSDIEKFIGENLINKIGIAITVIGVGIGAKYSIEHQLISPLTRIILGYLMGIALLGFGIKLKKNYANYSAVLVSGAIAILYFITYSAYGFYDLIPQLLAFSLMFIFTVFTVVAAIQYNNQVIAHIGLVGAYAVPFLLSDGSGRVAILFSYMAIINMGILLIAFKKYWKSLYYSSFIITWLIYSFWYAAQYEQSAHIGLSLVFLSVFFATFYAIFLAYKLLQKEKFDTGDIMLLLANSFIFYGLGYAILSPHQIGAQLLGLFTLSNAIVHFGVSAVIFRKKLADRNLFFLVAGLVLVFITIAIPVQLDGNWVTLLWAFEAALLFWIGRTKDVPVYEKLSYPLMYLAFFSIIHDWLDNYNSYFPEEQGSRLIPLLNIHFLSSVLFISAFIFINYIRNNKVYTSPRKGLYRIIDVSIPAILLIVLYYAFRIEIETYWNQLYTDSEIRINKNGQDYPDMFWNYDLKRLKTIWVINYSLFFFSMLSFVNITKIKSRALGLVNMCLSTFCILIFLVHGLYLLSELRETYLDQTLNQYYDSSSFNIGIRYISFCFVALALTSVYRYLNREFMQPVAQEVKVAFDFLLYTSILWIASSEWITWMELFNFQQSYKLGLSILWGSYALLLIAYGIWKNKKHLRVGAIALFAVTLIKLFFYDISHLNTIAKTIVFVSLGILLLLISFLYNKHKHRISPDNEN